MIQYLIGFIQGLFVVDEETAYVILMCAIWFFIGIVAHDEYITHRRKHDK